MATSTGSSNNPINVNYLSPLNFRFLIKKTPNLNFFVQRVNIPAVTISPANEPNPFVKIPLSGEHINFDYLQVSFKIDEGFNNYNEIFQWLIGLGKPDDFDEFAALEARDKFLGEGERSDIIVTVLSPQENPMYAITYRDAFPIALAADGFNTVDGSVTYINAHCQFAYTSYSIGPVI